MSFKYIFKRVEKKYMLSEKQYEFVLDEIQKHMHIDEYGKTTINNIYFDNAEDQLIETSIAKPVYKEKLRLRSYGTPNNNSTVFFEIKKKFKGVVYKRRISMTLKEAYEYIETGNIPENQKGNVPDEIDYMIKRYSLFPKVYIGYDRIALTDDTNPDLRITFDTNIVSRYEDVRLELGNAGYRLLEKGKYLMEIKIPGAMPMWLARVLSEAKLQPCSFSKFGQIHIQHKIREGYRQYV